MYGINKFKVLTIAILGLFIFIIGAIYTNTKEVTENKVNENQVDNNSPEYNNQEHNNQEHNNKMEDNYTSTPEMSRLSIKINELSRKVDALGEQNANGSRLYCNVQGIMEGNNIQSLSQEAAIQEARNNGRNLVLTCSFQ